MKHYLLAFLIGLLALPAGLIQAQGGETPIDVANAAQVIQLARFGRGQVLDVNWSPDGSTLLLAGSVGIWLYDAVDPSAPPVLLTGHAEEVNSAVFGPDGLTIASGSRDDTVRLWDSSGAATILEDPTMRMNGIKDVAFAPDGSLAGAGSDYDVHVWDASGEHRFTVEGHTRTINALVYSPDGSLLASASDDNSVRLWDAATGVEMRVIQHTSAVKCLAFSPDGALVAGGDNSGDAVLWDAASGEQIALLDRERGGVNDVAFSPDGALLATANQDGLIRLWDVASAAQVAEWEGHEREATDLAYSPDGTRLASVDVEENVFVWDTATGTQVVAVPGHTDAALSAVFNTDASLIIEGHSDSEVYLRDRTGDDISFIYSVEHHKNIDGNQTIVAFSPDESLFASADGFGVYLRDVASGAEAGSLVDFSSGLVNSFAFSPDGTLLAVTTWDGNVLLWDVAEQALLTSLVGHTDQANSVAFSTDGSLLLTSSDDGTVRVWGLP